MNRNTDHQPHHDIHQRNQKACDCVAFHKFGRTIKGAEKLGLRQLLFTPLFRLLMRDRPSRKIGVNSKLATRHSVQSKPRTDLRHTSRTLGDHHEIHN